MCISFSIDAHVKSAHPGMGTNMASLHKAI